MEVKLSDGTTLNCLDSPAHSGGEGDIYLTSDGTSIIKLYHTAEYNRKQSLEAIIGKYNAVQHEKFWSNYFCWPDGVVVAPRLGVKMPKAPDNLKSLDWFVLPKARSTISMEQLGTWSGHISIALKLSRAMRRLHQLGLCHSDLSRKNCLVNPTTGQVSLIDIDGLVVPGILPPRVFGTPEFMAPEIIAYDAKPSIYTDLHSLAVLIYQTLLFRHPLKGPKVHSNNPEEDDRLMFGERALYIENHQDRSNQLRKPHVKSSILGSSLSNLLGQAFIKGLLNPAHRPLAASWESALIRLVDRTIACTNPSCRGKHFPFIEEKLHVCPWCNTPWKDKSSLALIDLYRPVSGRKGQFVKDDFMIVGFPGRKLHEWHIYPDRPPSPLTNSAPYAEIQYDNVRKNWTFCNLSPEKMVVLRPGKSQAGFTHGQNQELENEMRIILGESPTARLAFVRIIHI